MTDHCPQQHTRKQTHAGGISIFLETKFCGFFFWPLRSWNQSCWKPFCSSSVSPQQICNLILFKNTIKLKFKLTAEEEETVSWWHDIFSCLNIWINHVSPPLPCPPSFPSFLPPTRCWASTPSCFIPLAHIHISLSSSASRSSGTLSPMLIRLQHYGTDTPVSSSFHPSSVKWRGKKTGQTLLLLPTSFCCPSLVH